MTDEFNDWWDKDALTQTNPYSENTPVYWAWEGWLAAKRAIEAECRVPDYVWMIGTKGFMALFATEEAANDWQQMNGTNTPASYIQPVRIPVIAAAPKPEKADPDCECGAVASEHCPACEPVAQEPFGIWHQGDTEEESDFFLFKDSGDVSCPNCIKLYTAPPDQSAEVSMTPAASIFKDEVARLNAEVERLREILSAQVSQAESQQTVYRNRIAELERLRFFLSIALTGQDWLDVERFIDDLKATSQPEKAEPVAQWENARFVQRVLEGAQGITEQDKKDALRMVREFRSLVHASAAPQPDRLKSEPVAGPDFCDRPTRPALEAVFRDRPEYFEPDCECGAVASEHCPACEPVAQEPVAFLIEGFDGNGKRVAAVIQQNADNARNSASVFAEHYPSVKTSGLYLAPPDLAAEVERLRKCVRQLETNAAEADAAYRNHIADLERQQTVLVEALEKLARLKVYLAPPDQSAEVERLKADWLKLYEEFAKANNANYARIAELARQRDVLAKLLCRYRNETPPGHQPHMIAHEVDAALASVKGNAEVTGVTTGENDAT